jgi:hypothetical protein
MTSSIITNPNLLSPVNNLYGNYFLIGNPSYSITNFKYQAKLNAYYENNVINEINSVDTFPPRPNTGYGLYSGYNSLLSLTTYDLNLFITQSQAAFNGIVLYNINYGFQWNPNYIITGSASGGELLQVGSNFGYTFSYNTNFTIGDIITVQSQNPYINGTQAIINILSPSSFEVNLAFSTASNVSTGVITNMSRWEGTSSNYFGYNGTRQYWENNFDFSGSTNSVVMGQYSNTNFCTEYPNNIGKLILPLQYETLSMFINPTVISGVDNIVQYNLYNSGSLVDTINLTFSSIGSLGFLGPITTMIPGSVNTYAKIDIPVGTQFINTLYIGNYDSYTVKFGYNRMPAPTIYSLTMSYTVDNSCELYSNVRVMWLNKYGSFEYFNFRLDDQKSYNITRNEFRQILPVPYNIGARERTVLSEKVVEQHTINTEWISQDVYSFLQGILTSPEIFIVNEKNNNIIPIIVTDTSFVYKTVYRNQIFMLTVTYELSSDIERQKM